ncbi:M81 family metallopeptidase [Variovorax sp. PCZ-1]|uniref:M81 family metallopeptidase n=1 Tax=Variovorax sp. PCZ-1 TaxID=2835533 RepID=UPI001BCE8055|nr:M81 family metallopeptidase [Variovorax sp. PCZ-1]MBS7809157.1 M81 family metallopeptidase [Variovorax sp. PCZ-1]
MRIFIAGYQHETNTFAPTLADWDAFNAGHTFPAYRRGAKLIETFKDINIPVGGFIQAALGKGWQLVPSVWAGATPSSYVTTEAFERICGDICEDLREAVNQGIDAVYLDLHGAAVAQNADDSEGELIARIRAIVGEAVPIVGSLDLHANVTERMLSVADALVSYRTYPHIDMADTGRLAAKLLERRIALGRKEKLHYQRFAYMIPLNAQSTWMQPAKRLYDELIASDAANNVVLSFCMGFPAADFAECAPMIWGYGEKAEMAVSALFASASPAKQWDPGVLPVAQAVAIAIERAAQSDKPIVIADTQDNPGAGGDSNTTGVLHELLRQGAGKRFPNRVALGMLYDPESANQVHIYDQKEHVVGVESAQSAIKNRVIDLNLGTAVPTFTGVLSDPPVQGSFRIEQLSDGVCTYTGPMMTGVTAHLGKSCALNIEGIRVAVVSGKAQLLDRELLRMVGINAEEMKIIVVKSSNHFRADFTPLVADSARDVIVAKAAGPMAADAGDLPWKKLSPTISPSLPV